MKVLWTAKGEVGFCEQKATEFIEKQQSWGWECNNVSAQQETPEVPETPETMDSNETETETETETGSNLN